MTIPRGRRTYDVWYTSAGQPMLALSKPAIARSRELLASPRLVWLLVGVAILLGLPTLDIGLVGDDLAHYDFLRRQHEGRSAAPWWNMFSLVEGPSSRNIGLRTSGRYPWWIDPDLRIVFFRPVTVATHHFDHWLWPGSLWLMHLHSVLWHALACALAWVLARRLCSSASVAGLAALIYTLSFTHTTPVAWLAHRNGLVSTVFALAMLLAHDRWRRDGRKLAGVLAPVALLASLLSAEAGVAAMGFLVAHAIFIDGGAKWSRALALVPGVVTIVVWRVVYTSMGFGATGSGAYVDPLGDPLSFVANFPVRYLWLLSASISPPLMAGGAAWLWVGLTVAVAAVMLVFVVRRSSNSARYGVLAAVLGCVPLTASHPGDRLLVLTSFGMALIFAELIDTCLRSDTMSTSSKLAGVLVAVVHVLAPPVGTVLFSTRLGQFREQGEAPVYGEALPNEGLARRGLVIVHAPNFLSAEYLPLMRKSQGLEAPNFSWLLHEGTEPPTIARIDKWTLELHDPRGWPPNGFSAYWRSSSRKPFAVGETIKTIDYVAEVLEVADGKAIRVLFRFRAPLEHPSFVWCAWDGEDFAPLAPGAFGK